jgi:hypothetical protein
LQVAVWVALIIFSAKFTFAAAAAVVKDVSVSSFSAFGSAANSFAVHFSAFSAIFSRTARVCAIAAQITVLEKELAELAGC